MNKTEENTQLIQTKKEIIDSDIQQVPVQPVTKEIKVEEDLNHIKLYSDVENPEDNDAPQDLNELNTNTQNQIYTNEQIIKEQTNYSNQLNTQFDLDKILQQQQQNSGQNNIQTMQQIKETKVIQTTSNPQIIQTQTQEQSGANFDIDAFLKQGTVETQNTGLEGYLQQQTTTENTQIQGYNLENFNNINTTQTESNTNIDWNLNNVEIATETKVLDPIINKVGVNYSVNKAIMKESTNKVMVSENVLPVSYLPEKVNKIIVDNQVTTLPLITAGNKVTYDTLQPIVHESKVYLGEANSNSNTYNNLSGYNLEQNSTNLTMENNTISSDANFDYSNWASNSGNASNAALNYNYGTTVESSQNGYVDGSAYNFTSGNNANNMFTTTKTTTTTTTTTNNASNLNPAYSFQATSQTIPITGGQNNQYGFQFEEYKATSY